MHSRTPQAKNRTSTDEMEAMRFQPNCTLNEHEIAEKERNREREGEKEKLNDEKTSHKRVFAMISHHVSGQLLHGHVPCIQYAHMHVTKTITYWT